MREVTDPNILAQLNGTPPLREVTDPSILAQLNGQPQELSFLEQQRQRGVEKANLDYAAQQGQITQPEAEIRKVGQFAGGVNDAVSGLMATSYHAAMTDKGEELVKQQLTKIASTPIGQAGIEALKTGGDIWNTYKQANPRTAGLIEAGANIFMAAPVVGAGIKKGSEALLAGMQSAEKVPQAIEGLKDATGSIIKGAEKQLPENRKILQPLVEAKAHLFGKPNRDLIGESVNRGISQSYGEAKKAVNKAYTAAQETGNFDIPAPNIINKLDNITTYLDEKLGKNTADRGAFRTLDDIKENILVKNPVTVSVAGEKVPPRTISANDAIEMEKAINEALPQIGKAMKSGDVKLMDFKNHINSLLDEASAINPDFGANYQNAKQLYGEMADTYHSKLLNQIWKPEDYKKTLNNPNKLPSETASRASKTLGYLNTEDTGKIMAVLKALPPEQGQYVINAALKLAKEDKVSLTNAAAQLIRQPLNPSVGLSTALRLAQKGAGKAPLEKAINTTKGLRKAIEEAK